jgi:arylsulfatase
VPDSPQIRAGGTVTLYVDETTVASGRIDKTLRRISHTEGLDIGRDALTAVSEEYVEGDNAFDGEIFGVRYTLL